MTSSQLTFDLPIKTALGRDDFYVSSSNTQAVDALESWVAWPSGRLILLGAASSGKTHLAHIWSEAAGGHILDAQDLTQEVASELQAGPICVDNAHFVGGAPEKEVALFHIYNQCGERQCPLLVTGVGGPQTWGLTLPDLLSRMMSCQVVRLENADDVLLSAVLAKHFADRQLRVGAEVITYIAARMDRSLQAVGDIVAQLDWASLKGKRPVTTALARQILE